MTVYIYGLFCPLAGTIRYVGKTKNLELRFKLHLAKALSGDSRHHSSRWIAKLHRAGFAPSMMILRKLEDSEDWQQAEKNVILEYRERGSALTNMTGGGDGFHAVLPEVLAKRVASRKVTMAKPEERAAHSRRMIAIHARPGVKELHSQSAAASWVDPETRQNYLNGMNAPEAKARRAAAALRRYQNPEEVAAHSERMKLVAQRPEAKAQIKAASNKRWDAYRADIEANPPSLVVLPTREETKAKQSASAFRRWSDPERAAAGRAALRTPEHRANLRQKALDRATPEYRAAQAERTRLSWEKRRAKKVAEVKESSD